MSTIRTALNNYLKITEAGTGVSLATDALRELDAIEAEHRWIDCKEQLPKDDVPVLVAWKGSDHDPCVGLFYSVSEAGLAWRAEDGGAWVEPPTHWKPLPTNP